MGIGSRKSRKQRRAAIAQVGTEFRAPYKGQAHVGRVEGGALVIEGKRYDSPSPAAVSITGSNVNGWRFWEARLPGQAGWKIIESLRRA